MAEEDVERLKRELKRKLAMLKRELEEVKSEERPEELGDSEKLDSILRIVEETMKKQNEIADKVDYLLSVLVEASEEMGEDKVVDLLTTLTKTQMELLEKFEELADSIKALKEGSEKERKIVGLLERIEDDLRPLSERLARIEGKIDNMGITLSTLNVKKIDALSKKLETTVSELTAMKSIVSETLALEKEDVELARQAVAMRERLSEIYDSLEKIESSLVSGAPGEEVSRVEEIEREVKALREALDNFLAKDVALAKALAEKLDEVEQKVVEVKRKYEVYEEEQTKRLEAALKALEERLRLTEERLTELENLAKESPVIPKIEEVKGLAKEIDSELDKVLEELGEREELLEKYSARLADLIFSFEKLEEKIRDVEDVVREREIQIQQIREEVPKRIEASLEELKKRLEKLEKIVIAGKRREKRYGAEIKKLREDVQDLLTKINALMLSIAQSKIGERLRLVIERLESLSDLIAQGTAKDVEIDQEVDELLKIVRELAQSLDIELVNQIYDKIREVDSELDYLIEELKKGKVLASPKEVRRIKAEVLALKRSLNKLTTRLPVEEIERLEREVEEMKEKLEAEGKEVVKVEKLRKEAEKLRRTLEEAEKVGEVVSLVGREVKKRAEEVKKRARKARKTKEIAKEIETVRKAGKKVEEIGKTMKKMKEKVETLEKTVKETPLTLMGHRVKRLRKPDLTTVHGVPLQDFLKVVDFLSYLKEGEKITISELARKTGVSKENALKSAKLLARKKLLGVKLEGAGILGKLLGKEPMIVRRTK